MDFELARSQSLTIDLRTLPMYKIEEHACEMRQAFIHFNLYLTLIYGTYAHEINETDENQIIC